MQGLMTMALGWSFLFSWIRMSLCGSLSWMWVDWGLKSRRLMDELV